MPVLERIWTLLCFRLRLLTRRRACVASGLLIPAAVGIFLGIGGGPAARYGIFLALLLSSVTLPIGLVIRGWHSQAFPGGNMLHQVSWASAAIVVLAAQAFIYRLAVGLADPPSAPGLGLSALAVAISLALGLSLRQAES
jgi:hypothetical protein